MLRFIVNCVAGVIDTVENTLNAPATIRTILNEKDIIRNFTRIPHFEQRAHLEMMEERYRQDLASIKQQITANSINDEEAKQRLAVVNAALRRVTGLRARIDVSESTVCNARAVHILSNTVQNHQFIKDSVRSSLPSSYQLMRERVREQTLTTCQDAVKDYLDDVNNDYAHELVETEYSSSDITSQDISDSYIEAKLQGLANFEIPVTVIP